MSNEAHSIAADLAVPTAPASADPMRPANVPWTIVWLALILVAALASLAAGAARHSMAGMFLPAVALGVLILAAGFDGATGHIPNPLTYTAILHGLSLNILASIVSRFAPALAIQWIGAVPASDALMGFCLCAGIALACLIFGDMGGGDMKLLAAMGALLGLQRVGVVLIVSLMFAAAYGLINLLIRGHLNRFIASVAAQFLSLLYLHRTADTRPTTLMKVPMAVPLLVGLLVSQIITFPVIRNWLGF